MQTKDPSLLFLSSQQLSDAAAREGKIKAAEKVGSPITLSSKVIDMAVLGSEVWTAESGWQARRVDLNTGATKRVYKGHQGPVTSVALNNFGSNGDSWLALFTASWDKTIRVWDAETAEVVATLEGHTDFVKSVTILPTTPPLLLSTSSDRSCRLWDLSPLDNRGTPVCRQIMKEHTRPVDTAAYAISEDTPSSLTVWTADSMGVIKEWSSGMGPSIKATPTLTFVRDVPGHETSVAALAVAEEGLWSGSTDNSAILHGERPITLLHPKFVKSVLPNPHQLPYILTGSDDEHIRVWDGASVEGSTATTLSLVEGHCGTVTAIAPWIWKRDGSKVQAVVSASLDGTLRRWTISELLHPKKLDYSAKPPNVTMTEEEERELAELLSDDDDM